MKKTVLLLLAAGVSFTAVDAKAKKNKKDKQEPAPVVNIFTNDVDSMSYALGLNVGGDFFLFKFFFFLLADVSENANNFFEMTLLIKHRGHPKIEP